MSIDLDKADQAITAFSNVIEFTGDDPLRPKLPKAVAKAVIDNHVAMRAEIVELREAVVDRDRKITALEHAVEDVKKTAVYAKPGSTTEG